MTKFYITIGIDQEADLDVTLAYLGASVTPEPTRKDTTYSVVAEFGENYDECSLQGALDWLLEVTPEVVEIS